MAIGKAGSRNAGIFAAQILALSDPLLLGRVKSYREKMVNDVEEKDKAVRAAGKEVE
jgi:phosphoribosylcarboxyaminoimidazole (NCAIR) mutase